MKKRLCLCLLLGYLLSACALLEAAALTSSDEVMARVNGVALTRSDLNTRMALASIADWLTNGGTLPSMDDDPFVNKWIDSELMAQAAAKANVSATRDEAEAEVVRLLREAKLDERDRLHQLS